MNVPSSPVRALLARLCVLASLLAAAAASSAGEAVQVAVDSANAPFMYASGTVARGLYPALLAATYAQIGKPVAVTAVPWPRVVKGIDEGRFGAAGIYRNAERDSRYDFSEPLFVEHIGVYFRAAKPLAFRGLADLHGLRVGVILGWSYGDEFDRARRDGKFTVEEVQTDLQNLRKLELGRIDAVLMVVDSAPSLFAGGRFPGIARAEHLLGERAAYLAFNKQAAMGPALREFNRALAELRASGAYARIVARELETPAR